jgi:hypothetical protein
MVCQCPHLRQRVAVRSVAIYEYSLSIVRDPHISGDHRLRARLGLNHVNARRTDGDMIDVEAVSRNVVKDAVAVTFQLVEDFGDASLSLNCKPYLPGAAKRWGGFEDRDEENESDRLNRHDPRAWRRTGQPPPPFNTGQCDRHKAYDEPWI